MGWKGLVGSTLEVVSRVDMVFFGSVIETKCKSKVKKKRTREVY